MPRLPLWLATSGLLLFAATTTLALTQARYGTPVFFSALALIGACQIAALWRSRRAGGDRRLLLAALAFAVACRVPLAAGPVNYDSDMVRYIWDGRVQRLGLNPYSVLPADPALAWTHTADTIRMPSRFDRTPYPPAAQLFFRALVTVRDSPRVMKAALLACDLLTIAFLLRWLRLTGRDPWLVLTYAWSPLVIIEIAHGGHIDALGTMWVAAAACWLTARRTALSAAAFTLAVATKFLPVVLAPLFVGRVRPRDIALGAALLAALYAPFVDWSGAAPIGAVPNVLAHIRFNSPVFRPLAWVITPAGAAAFGLTAALAYAAWARVKLDAGDPAAWAWPMALALVCAPVVYPWYLLYVTPFLFTRAAAPVAVWTFTVLPVYVVWERAREGARWRVPTELMVVEYGLVVLAVIGLLLAARRRTAAVAPRAGAERISLG